MANENNKELTIAAMKYTEKANYINCIIKSLAQFRCFKCLF